MNNRENLIKNIDEFLSSDKKGMLITGTHQYAKHKQVMKEINKRFAKKKILFVINGMDNLTDDAFIGLKRKPKIGEKVTVGNNIYEFATPNLVDRTSGVFDFAIIYPIDYYAREKSQADADKIFRFKSIGKLFLVSWTDDSRYDYSVFSNLYDCECVFDAEEEDLEYHKRVKKSEQGERF